MERKIRLGYLDEDYLHRSSFYQHFKDNFEVITWDNFEEIRTLEQLRKEIDEQEIEVLAVDYKLAENGDVCYNGDEVVQMLYNSKRYFPVFMVTSHITSALAKMDNVFLVNDKSNFFKNGRFDGRRVERLRLFCRFLLRVGTFCRVVRVRTFAARNRKYSQRRKHRNKNLFHL